MWELDGIGYHIEEAHSGLLYLSMEGGAPITIYGQMLANNIANNFIVFNPSCIEGVSVFGPPLSGKSYYSNSLQAETLTTPLFEQMTMSSTLVISIQTPWREDLPTLRPAWRPS